jgi:lysophospholipase L1-like esterase
MREEILKVIGRLAAILMMCVFLLSACNIEHAVRENLQHPNIIKKDLKVVGLGDSLTVGVGDESGKGYIGMVADQLKQEEGVRSVSVENFAVMGDRTVNFRNKLKEKDVQKGIEKADIIFMTIGGNDLMKVVRDHIWDLSYEPFQMEQKNFQARLIDIHSEIRKHNSRATIVYVGLYNPFKFTLSEIKEFDDIVEDWNSAAEKALSKDPNVKVVQVDDLFAEYRDEKRLSEDEFHPNEKGYSLIADRVYNNAVKTILP